MFKTIFALVCAVALIGAAAFGLNYAGYLGTAFFAPKYEAVRRDTMIQSRAYSEASAREMYRFRREYQAAATDEQRAAVRAFALHEADGMDRSLLPADLQAFIATLDQ
jgi:hypothetical protein